MRGLSPHEQGAGVDETYLRTTRVPNDANRVKLPSDELLKGRREALTLAEWHAVNDEPMHERCSQEPTTTSS